MAILHPIRTDEDHRVALQRLEALWDSPVGSPEFEEFELLGTLVDAYEREHHPIGDPSPLGQVRYLLDQRLLSSVDLRGLLEGSLAA